MGRRLGLGIALGIVVAGCSAARPPSAKLATADVAIHEAEDAGAEARAPGELHMARDMLERAQRAVDDEEYDDAYRLAEEAWLAAQSAEAKANATRAREEADEAERALDALHDDEAAPIRPPY